MSNETIHVLGASIRAKKFGLDSGLIILVKDSKKGKTQTIKMLERDYRSDISFIPPGTVQALYDFLASKSNHSVFCIDDRTKYGDKEWYIAIQYAKVINDGEIKPLKLTYYTSESAVSPIPTNSWVWICLNKTQLDRAYPQLFATGLYQRAIFLRVSHSDKELARIIDMYTSHNWSKSNVPTLKLYADWYCNKPRNISSKEHKIIQEAVGLGCSDSVEIIARVMSEKGFAKVLPMLTLSANQKYFEEVIEFTDNILFVQSQRSENHEI